MSEDRMENSIKALQASIQAIKAKMDTNHEVINKKLDTNYEVSNKKLDIQQEEDIRYRAQIQQSLDLLNSKNNDLANKLLELKTKDNEERKDLKEASIKFNKFQLDKDKLKMETKEPRVELKLERKQLEAFIDLEEQASKSKLKQEEKEKEEELEDLRVGVTTELSLYLQELKLKIINEVGKLIAQQETQVRGELLLMNNNKRKNCY
ncbi:Tkp3 protein [Vanderwaltozyma polyspora DSM 70294]|uniref:Tkp3 protein n=1 Tax=Vanderwaltozyma polyspora (strain ATCC 22028 / DSM 70294 / BCRC 21397 / CBS 2163 / NBRC 10782 / NRRL Y-8283 / UCD 57-17) TaxID=436907 RepID=A7TEP4_VANPO|nr:Tkp3 protein [Vanderwaltozyma polyspora DSM 70294]EDO19351.1 Tkp3 protein [Vanderwaltozyma polyspora DSM 70294]